MTEYETTIFDGLAAGLAFMAIEIQADGEKVPEHWLELLASWEKKLKLAGMDESIMLYDFIDRAVITYNQYYGEKNEE